MLLSLGCFDGPLDVLVYLIQVNEMDIFNISISVITDQYMQFLRHNQNFPLHTAGEYLAMAAQLIEIKARMLIPILQNKPIFQDEVAASLDELNDNDPRKPLVAQLIEFAAMKQACATLAQRALEQKIHVPSGEFKRRQNELLPPQHPIVGHAFDLTLAFERVLLRFRVQQNAPRLKVHSQAITIEQRILDIQELMTRTPVFSLIDFFYACTSRAELVISLLAVLEMCKSQMVVWQQEVEFGPITIIQQNLEGYHEGWGQEALSETTSSDLTS